MSSTVRSAGSVRIAYEEHGSGPAAVFVHAFPLDRTMWRPQLEALHGHRLIALDLRGFGQSEPPPPGGVRIGDLAADVRAVLTGSGLARAHLVGCSMGGYVLMELLRQSPTIGMSLALVDTRAGADSAEARAGRLATVERLRRGAPGEREAFEEGLLGRLLGKTTLERRPELVAAVRERMGRASLAGVAGALEAMAARPDSTAVLARFEQPALVVVGAEDTLIPPDEARKLAAAMPRADLLTIPEAGHLPSLEAPGVLTAALQRLWQNAG